VPANLRLTSGLEPALPVPTSCSARCATPTAGTGAHRPRRSREVLRR
jgi:hypothetical protein